MRCEIRNNDGGDGGKDESERYGNLLDPKDAKTFWIEKVFTSSTPTTYGTKILKSPGASVCTSPRHRDWLGCSEKGVSLVVLAGVSHMLACFVSQTRVFTEIDSKEVCT